MMMIMTVIENTNDTKDQAKNHQADTGFDPVISPNDEKNTSDEDKEPSDQEKPSADKQPSSKGGNALSSMTLKIGGHQYRASVGDHLEVDRLDYSQKEQFIVSQVLQANVDDQVLVGSPYVQGCEVVLEVINHYRDPKVIVFKKKRRKKYRRMKGHRQQKTLVKICQLKVV